MSLIKHIFAGLPCTQLLQPPSIKQAQAKIKPLNYIFAALLCLLSTMTSATNIEITGVYSPDPQNLNNTKFKITSKENLCGSWDTACNKDTTHLFLVNNLVSGTPVRANALNQHSDVLDWVYFQGNPTPYTVILKNANNREITISVKNTHLGAGMKWQDNWYSGLPVNALATPPQCTMAINRSNNKDSVRNVYALPTSGICAAKGANQSKDLNNFWYYDLTYGFEIRTSTSPLDLAAGTYTGELKLTVGEEGHEDIYIGHHKSLNEQSKSLTLNFTFTVTHMLKVETPGDTSVPLQPKNGWQQWLANGSYPTQLSGSSTFNLSSSVPFTMRLLCQHTATNGNCTLQSQLNATKSVEVRTAVSLPTGISASMKPVQRYPLSEQKSAKFTSPSYISGRPGSLHFDIAEDQVKQILNDGAQTTARRYSGDITVIWDAQI